MLKRTPLYAIHAQAGGRWIEFGGWEMPLQYTSIVEEHRAVRTAAGLFDISHMGQVRLLGPRVLDFLNQILTNDLQRIRVGQGQYTLLCNESGGVIDDLFIYRLADQEYLLVVNASRTERDMAWINQQLSQFFGGKGVQLEDLANHCGAIAVQGPRAAEFIDVGFNGSLGGGAALPRIKDLKKRQLGNYRFAGTPVWVARTGYTGEDGFEVFAPAEIIPAIWNRILTAGQPFGLRPAGLGARDTLRIEAGYPLFGHELDEQRTPVEAGLDRFVALEKPHFIGREVLARQLNDGVRQKGIAFKCTEKGPPPRPHYSLWSTEPAHLMIGEVVSGTQSPCLGVGIGMGYVLPAYAQPGTAMTIEIRRRHIKAEVVAKPIYRKPSQAE